MYNLKFRQWMYNKECITKYVQPRRQLAGPNLTKIGVKIYSLDFSVYQISMP